MARSKNLGIRPSITGGKCLDDKVEAYYSINPPYSTVNEFGTHRVYYDELPNLSKPPEKVGRGDNERTEVRIPHLNVTLVFIFDISPYGSSNLYGPYIKR